MSTTSDRRLPSACCRLVLVASACLLAACSSPSPGNRLSSLYPELILTRVERRQDAELKAARVREFLRREDLSGVLVTLRPNYAWATSGAEGSVPIFYGNDGRRFFITHSDAGRGSLFEDLADMGFEARFLTRQATGAGQDDLMAALRELSGGRPFGADTPCAGARNVDTEIASLRVPLTEGEMREYHWLGAKTAEVVEGTCRQILPGMTDRGIEAQLSDALMRHAVRATYLNVNPDIPVAGEDGKPRRDVSKIEHQAAVSVCAERWGLRVALTRLVHLGPMPSETRGQLAAAARINAGFWARTLPGASVRSILEGALSDYTEYGYAGEWQKRNPGGEIGYEGGDGLPVADSTQTIRTEQAFAWTACVADLCIEDTILLVEDRMEVLTETPDWPRVESRCRGKIYRSPGILMK
ncbi:MAG TPA: hypothetical protein VE398_06905 [Acidobacteriota bacterium]|nr:hypothetical protein [Acidobacteriota bacterium]